MIAGRYSLDREIGRGGTGVVWLGRDDVLGRQVALKRIGRLPGADSTDLTRAEREARLSARLNHPNVVAVFDVVADSENDARWLVMEYVDGVNLDELVRQRGRLSVEEAAPLIRQAAEALVAAHDAGIAHRDVKPSNILVDRAGQVKITDFGIARVATDPSLTQTGMVTGSPSYLAPEIATGGRSDGAADVWALGATAFHLLAGRPPYETNGNVLGTLYRIVNEEPPRLADAGAMADLLEGTMVRDPARRWTMRQVRDAVSEPQFSARSAGPALDAPPAGADDVESDGTRVLGTLGAAPTDPGPPETAAASGRRTPGRAALVVLAAVLLLAAGVGVYLATAGGDRPTANPTHPSATQSGASKRPSASPTKPTAQGMESFIRSYVATVAANPDSAWKMLTPGFQRQSGGIETYRRFWDSATNGRVLSISADPKDMVVSYQVHFDNFRNGPGPTVLDLTYDHGRYQIAAEHTKGFVPAG